MAKAGREAEGRRVDARDDTAEGATGSTGVDALELLPVSLRMKDEKEPPERVGVGRGMAGDLLIVLLEDMGVGLVAEREDCGAGL